MSSACESAEERGLAVSAAAAAATRVFTALPGLCARLAEDADLPDPGLLRRAIEPSWEIGEHSRHRLAIFRYGDEALPERARWLRGALSSFGVESTYLVALGPRGSPFWRVEPEDPVHWLTELAGATDRTAPGGHGQSPIRPRCGRGVEDLTVLSPDGTRALLLQTAEDELHSYHLPTRVLVHRGVSGDRLFQLLCELDPRASELPKDPLAQIRWASGPRPWRFDPNPHRIDAELLHACARRPQRWSRSAPQAELAALFREGLKAMMAADEEDGRPPAIRCRASIGRIGPLTWCATSATVGPDWIERLWHLGSLDRLFVSSCETVLGFVAIGSDINGFLCNPDDVRST